LDSHLFVTLESDAVSALRLFPWSVYLPAAARLEYSPTTVSKAHLTGIQIGVDRMQRNFEPMRFARVFAGWPNVSVVRLLHALAPAAAS